MSCSIFFEKVVDKSHELL